MFLFTRRGVAALAIVCLGLAAPLHAQQSTIETLTLSQALGRALQRNPDLAVFPAARRAAEGQKLQAGLYPNPVLGTELEDFAGSGVERGFQALQTTLTLSQLIPLGGKLGKRVGVAQAAIGSVEADYAVARLDVLAETARRFVDVAEAQARVTLTQRSIALAERTLETVKRRVKAGATSSAEINRAQVALTRTRLDAQRAQADLDAAKIALAAMWGDSAPDFGTVEADLAALPQLEPFAQFAAAVERSPRLVRFAAESRLREAELRLAKAQAVPDLIVGVGVRRLEHGATSANPDYGLVAGLSLPLKIFDRNQGNITTARARMEQIQAERDAAWLRIRTVLYGLYRADQQARIRAARLTAEAIPQADEALKLIQRGYAFGRFSFLDLLDAQRQVIALRADAIAAQADAHRLDAELERLSAEPVVAPLPATATRGVIR